MTATDATTLLTKARVNLIFSTPFFASLALRLRLVEDNTQPTGYTDGTVLGYNAHMITAMPLAEIESFLCHEVLHNACGHPWREKDLPFPKIPANTPPEFHRHVQRVARHEKANRAMDYAINPLLKQSGFTLGKDWLYDKQYVGKSMEEIYRLLPDPKIRITDKRNGNDKGGGCGTATGTPTPSEPGDGNGPNIDIHFLDAPTPRWGEVRDASGNSTAAEDYAEWKIAAQQAAHAARQQGTLPAHLQQFLDTLGQSKLDWRTILLQWMQERAHVDYSWSRPNRRYIGHGLYMPQLESTALGEIAVIQDTSGSMWTGLDLNRCAAEIRSILEDCRPEKIHLYFSDCAVSSSRIFERDEPFAFAPTGGGGTDFRPAFEALERDGIEPRCVLYFTDLEGTFPAVPPPYPVLWISVCDGKAPFGDTLVIAPSSFSSESTSTRETRP